jgi:hypothetical protein
MKEIKGSVMINVPAEKVWTSLTDFASYPEWNPFITQMKGELKEGNVFDVTVTLPGRKDAKFRSKTVKINPGKEMLFKGAIKRGLSEHRLQRIHVLFGWGRDPRFPSGIEQDERRDKETLREEIEGEWSWDRDLNTGMRITALCDCSPPHGRSVIPACEG